MAPPGNRTLVVVRHAKAERDAERDHDRRLTERGRADAAAAATAVSAALGDAGDGRSVALVSSAVRAIETWRALAPALSAPVQERVEDDLFQADTADVTAVLAGLDDGIRAAIVVGHNPTMEDTVRFLVRGGDTDALARLDEGLPTAAVAVLAYDGSWSDLGAESCRIEALEVGRA